MPASRPFAIVTGSSTGIGTGQAPRKKKGYDLLIAADEPEIEQAAASLRGGGTNAEAIQADLATIEGVVFETHGGEPKGGDQDSLTLVVELVRRTDADPFGAGARVDAPACSTRRRLRRLRSTAASSFDALFLDLMTRHHKGAVAMADSQLRDGSDPRLRIMAHAIRHEQQGEIALMHGVSGRNAVSVGFRNMFADNVNARTAFGVNQAH